MTINNDQFITIGRNQQTTIEKDKIESVNNHRKESTYANHWRETGGDYGHKVKGRHTRVLVDEAQQSTNTHTITAAKEIVLKGMGGTITIDSDGITLKGIKIDFKATAVDMKQGNFNMVGRLTGMANKGEPICIECEKEEMSQSNK